jgi:methyl-accepting chemotaxis protein
MPKNHSRIVFGKGKGYLSAASSQYRFIVFLIIILGVYTFLLKVFQKIAEIVQLPVFLPLALVMLLLFIGISGTLYSHKFVGPIVRIRKVIQHMADGELNITLRLRESDDPMLLDLADAISQLSERTRNSHVLIQEAARDLAAELDALREKAQQGSDGAELLQHLDDIRKKQELMATAVRLFGKAV